jgi:hypothetical protein
MLMEPLANIQDFVVQGGQAVTAGEVAAFRNHLAAYKLKAETLELEGQSVLREEVQFLLRYIEDVLDDVFVPADFSALPEAVFAVRYVARGVDIIPDSVPDIGWSDDAAVVGAVIAGHQEEFLKFCDTVGLKLPGAIKG